MSLKERSASPVHPGYQYLVGLIEAYFRNQEKFKEDDGVKIELIGKNKRVTIEAPVGGDTLILFKNQRTIHLTVENDVLGEKIYWVVDSVGPRKGEGKSWAKPLFSDHVVPAVWSQDLRKLDEIGRQEAIADFETIINRIKLAFGLRLPSLS